MNEQLQAFARETIKKDDVVDEIPADKLDWAMQQVQRTLEK